MTNNQQWQPPAGDADSAPTAGQNPPPPPGPYAPPAGQYPPPGQVPTSGQYPPVDQYPPGQYPPPAVPQYGQYLPAVAPQPQGWTPPRKPGLIPLRPLTLGDILGASFKTLRRNPKPTFGVSLLLQGVVLLLTAVVMGLVTAFAISRTEMAAPEDADAVAAGAAGSILLSAIIPFLFSLMAAGLMQGIIVLEVSRGALGEKLKFRELWRLAKGRLWALVGWVLLVTLVVIVAATVIVLAIIALVSQLGDASVAAAVILGIFAGLGSLALWAWLSTKLAMVPSALVIERLPLRQAMARSWRLTGGYFWRTFGILLLVSVILNVASQIITTPITIVFTFLAPLMTIGGDPTAAIIASAVTYLVLVAVTLVVSAMILVVQGAATALLYLDLRIRKEGLDLDLTRFVEARHAGDTTVPDPLRPGAAPAAPRMQGAPTAPEAGSPWA
ncbi:hypothetical protein [Diaminobutyricimonas sp. TR449]|uniref:hypothetical protein n=1 Tax=Diaminobutyricimonas sp. TR449 TaxID=2708076 RepID=UPI001421E35C|nr:hypothetical protein [Diaminobutyricimonas sp. TR449]